MDSQKVTPLMETSNQKTSFDPGWNDPPTFTYNSQQNLPHKPRNFLNKRVAFPFSGGSPSTISPSGSIPPVNSIIPPSLPPQSIHKNVNSEHENLTDSESVLQEVIEILLKFLDDSAELGHKGNDIKRRIGTMENMWKSGKLSSTVQSHMKELAHALQDNQPTKADDIHRALMVDHVSVVGTWMPGIKQLVHHCIARSELISIDEES